MVIITKIHNKYYNIENFKHPGGDIAIWHSYGRDATALFEMYHPFVNQDKLNFILSKYEITDELEIEQYKKDLFPGEDSIQQFEYNSEFAKELKSKVKKYFYNEAIRKSTTITKVVKATTNRWILIIFLNLLRFLSMIWWLSGSLWGLFIFPLFSWLGLSIVFHDAGHFSLSNNWKINKYMTYFGLDISEPNIWYHQHNIGHHAYTNIQYKDPDIYHASYIIRLSKYTPHKYLYNFNNITILIQWVLSFLANNLKIKFLFINKYIFNFIPVYLNCNLIYTKLLIIIYFTVNYIISYLWFNGNLLFVIIPHLITSFLFMLNSQITHLHQNTFTNDDNSDWYKHQVITSTNHSIGSISANIFSGGLNYQIEHHLFPFINHCHYPYIQPIIEKVCNKYQVPYKKFNGYTDALDSYYNHMLDLSKES